MELRDGLTITVLFVYFLLVIGTLFAAIWVLTYVVPIWFLVAIVIGIPIYNFNHLPLQHYWNLGVRTLYPHRQWALERWLVEKLLDIRLLTPRSPPALPIEMWEQILENVIHTPFMFDTTCHPSKFNLFIATQLLNYAPTEYYSSERYRKELRLVCRLWNSILSPKRRRWTRVSQSDHWNIPSGVRRVHFVHLFGDFCNSNLPDISTRVSREDNHTSLIPIVSIQSHIYSVSELEQSFSMLFDDPSNFGNLRSLIYAGNVCVVTPFVLQGVERSFSHLKVLFITSIGVVGSLQLEKLEVLYLNVQFMDTERWWFPSLRHVAVGPNSIQSGYSPSLHVPGPLENLLSLLLPMEHADIHADDEFWTSHSSLQFLGISCARFHVVSKPQVNHPLSYLYFTESEGSIENLSIRHAKKLIEGIPNLQTVTLPVYGDLFKPIYPPDWLILYHSQRSRGIRWLRNDGDLIMPRRVRRHNSIGPCEQAFIVVQSVMTMDAMWYLGLGRRIVPSFLATWLNWYSIAYGLWYIFRWGILRMRS